MMMTTTTAALQPLSDTTAAFAAVECNMITPCTAPPPNGAPRYVLPSSQYDPAKAAEEKFAKALAKKRNETMMKMKAEEEEEEEEASKAPEEEVVDSSTDSTASSSSFEE